MGSGRILFAIAIPALALACKRQSNRSSNGHLHELQPGQTAEMNMSVSGCFSHNQTHYVFSRKAQGQMFVKRTTNVESGSPDDVVQSVSELEVVAIDQELAQLKDQKNHFCTTSVYIVLVTPAGAGKIDKSQYSDRSCFGLPTLRKVLH